jgi:hypothetical protein
MVRGIATGLLALAVAATGCATGELHQASLYRGDSASVNWEVVGIRTTISDDDQQIRWNYTVILRESAGRAIKFEHLETSATGDTVTVRLTRLRSFTFGHFEVEGLHVGVYDVAPQIADLDGLLGTDFLHRFVVNVDVDAHRLTLERRP